MSIWDMATGFASAAPQIADAFELLNGIRAEIIRGNHLLTENNRLLSGIHEMMEKKDTDKKEST